MLVLTDCLVAAKCTAGHPFCRECVKNYVADRVGNRQFQLDCMSTDGCDAQLVPAEVRQFVPPKTITLLDKIQQEKELELAGLGGLEKCPFCVEYAVIIDNPDERLFRCEKLDCLKVSCRLCKKEGHLGISCAEAEKENSLPSLHAVEGKLHLKSSLEECA
jgi:TRIAD3 protein (E3 ubiquitin-protein ligase RNF216)